MAWRVEIKSSAVGEISRLPRRDQRRVISAIETLAENPRPRGARKLVGGEEAYRIRVGDYRVVYQIADDVLIVFVVRVGHRRDIYRRR
ncbi:MAG: type II toxin-antitoxin system RelE family toxin [Phycisphaerae bacterium]